MVLYIIVPVCVAGALAGLRLVVRHWVKEDFKECENEKFISDAIERVNREKADRENTFVKVNRCVMCGAIIPEGSLVCKECKSEVLGDEGDE